MIAALRACGLLTAAAAVLAGAIVALDHFLDSLGEPAGRHHRPPDPGPPEPLISLLVPFRADRVERTRNWTWLRSYYEHALPGAEIVMGSSHHVPFCKTEAVNDAFSRARGDIIVLLDADCYIDSAVITECAATIRQARSEGERLWYIPYRRFYRLSRLGSEELLASDPADPVRFGDPPPGKDLDTWNAISWGHWYGAMIQVMPREAFIAAGGMDERFWGWGGEDISFMFAVDTLWGRHKTINGPVYHIHHPTISGIWQMTRQWEGQPYPEQNDWLSSQYHEAVGDKARMRSLLSGREDDVQ